MRFIGALALAALAWLGWREYDLARGLYDYSQWANDEGIIYLTRAIRLDNLTPGEQAIAYLSRSQLYGRKRQFANTFADANSAVELSPDYTAARLTRAVTYIMQRDYPAAREDLDFVIRQEPQNQVAHNLRGNLLWGLGDLDGALADFDAAQLVEHRTPYFYFQRGNALVQMKAIGGALSAYDAAIAGDPDLDEAYRNRAILYLVLGRVDRSLADFNTAIRLNPNIADWYGGRGDVHTAAGGFTEAVADYDHALNMDDTFLFTHRNRAFANLMLNKFDDAAKEFDLCAERAPNDPYIALWRYIAHARAGDGDAKVTLAHNAQGIDLKRWPGPAITMFEGKMDPPDLITTAMAAPQQYRKLEDCEATSFIGEYQLIHGQMDVAQMMFRRVETGCHPATLAHAAAIAELDRQSPRHQ